MKNNQLNLIKNRFLLQIGTSELCNGVYTFKEFVRTGRKVNTEQQFISDPRSDADWESAVGFSVVKIKVLLTALTGQTEKLISWCWQLQTEICWLIFVVYDVRVMLKALVDYLTSQHCCFCDFYHVLTVVNHTQPWVLEILVIVQLEQFDLNVYDFHLQVAHRTATQTLLKTPRHRWAHAHKQVFIYTGECICSGP